MYIQINEKNNVIDYIENCECPPYNYIYVDFEINDYFIKNYTKYKYENNKFIYDDNFYNENILNNYKQIKLKEISKQCEQTIRNGIEIKTSQGIEHFSLTDKDQINISNCYNMALQGLENILYHSDGNLCRVFFKK